MKVMMICPMFTANVAPAFNIESSSYGGWIEGYVDALVEFTDIQIIYVALFKSNENSIINKTINGINFRLLKYRDNDYLKNGLNDMVEAIHLFGTEMDYTLDCLEVVDKNRCLIHIQGLVGYCAQHYSANVQDTYKSNLLFDYYLKLNQRMMIKKGRNELLAIKKAKHVIGRTDFDEIGIRLMNHDINYHVCNEILRKNFYNAHPWSLQNIERNSVYVSQASYPLKGCHFIIQIISDIKKFYPNVKCYIGGENLLSATSIATKLHVSYASLVKRMIRDLHLEKNIIFIGNQTEQKVINNLIKAHVFLLSSSVENSPNSLAEAMMLGVPCVSSFVGGVSNFAQHKQDALLYPFHEPYLAAKYICDIFSDDEFANQLSRNAKKSAETKYQRKATALNLKEIYSSIDNRLLKQGD